MLKSLEKEEEFDSFLRNSQDKLLLVKFFTIWCSPCRELQENIETLLTEKKNLEVLKVDADKFPGLAQRPEFNIFSVPAVFLYWKGRKIKEWKRGCMSLSQLKEFIKAE